MRRERRDNWESTCEVSQIKTDVRGGKWRNDKLKHVDHSSES